MHKSGDLIKWIVLGLHEGHADPPPWVRGREDRMLSLPSVSATRPRSRFQLRHGIVTRPCKYQSSRQGK